MNDAAGCDSAMARVMWDRWPLYGGRPGCWSVYLLNLWDARGNRAPVADCVVDDFGRLVRVPA